MYNLNEVDFENYLIKLEKCIKNDCDYYLEHNECREFYNYILKMKTQLKDLVVHVKTVH